MSTDVEKISELLKAANEEKVQEIEAEIPFYSTSSNHGKMTIKAVWRRRDET